MIRFLELMKVYRQYPDLRQRNRSVFLSFHKIFFAFFEDLIPPDRMKFLVAFHNKPLPFLKANPSKVSFFYNAKAFFFLRPSRQV